MNTYDIEFKGRMLGSGRTEQNAWKKVKETYDVISCRRCTLIPPPPPRLTIEEYDIKHAELLEKLPEEFRSAISYMAYERGHSSGYEEVLNILSNLISDLSFSIKDFEKRIREETKKS